MGASNEAVSLFRQLIRHGKKFSNYNFKEYVLRRTREDFRVNRTVSDPTKLAALVSRGKEDLEIVKRQAMLSSMFKPDKDYVINMHMKQKQ